MNETMTRTGKSILVFAAGFLLVGLVSLLPGDARARAMDLLVHAGVAELARDERIPAPVESMGGRTMWHLPDSDAFVVLESVLGYQSRLEILVRVEREMNVERFVLLSGSEGPHVAPMLRTGTVDALSGATVTATAIRAAFVRAIGDVEQFRQESGL